MVEAATSIMRVLGLCMLLLTGIIIITFFVWVIKLEFSWFFGINLFKSMREKAVNFKLWLAKKMAHTSTKIDKLNQKGQKKMRLLEDLNEDETL